MPNVYKVAKIQWKRWPELAQRVFIEQYAMMMENPNMFLHPKMGRVCDKGTKKMWKTVAWNSAWIAADAVVISLKRMANLGA